MFRNSEEEDLEMVRFVAEEIHREMGRQLREDDRSVARLALVAILAMTRWAKLHPPAANGNDRVH
jgi:hypothetical protein